LNLRNKLDAVFDGRAFLRPLFYSYPGGLRFELSEGSDAIAMFLTAMRKAKDICSDVFAEAETITVVLGAYTWGNAHVYRDMLKALRRAGILIPRQRCIWVQRHPEEDVLPEDETRRVFLAFDVSKSLMENLLWCALSQDLGIQPSPHCSVYLAHLPEGLLVLPYDDRGMDIVGPNHLRLAMLYDRFQSYLLDYDRAAMDETFYTSKSRVDGGAAAFEV